MNMMNKCAKCRVDIPSGSKLILIPAKEAEISETANFVCNFV